MTLHRRQPFNRTLSIGMMLMAVTNVVKFVLERHTSMPEGPRDGIFGVLFGLVTAWLVGRLVTEPIDDLTGAALSVSQGDLGVSIERSAAVVGSIGSPRRMEYTAIGDAVNVASRVEGVAAVLGEPLLVTAATRAALRRGAALEELAPQRVKGQGDPIVVFRPMEESSPSPRARRR